MDIPDINCGIMNYQLNSVSNKVTQDQEYCSSECRTAIINLTSPALLTFTFTITSNAEEGFNTMTTFDYIYNVTCGAENQTISEESRSFVFALK